MLPHVKIKRQEDFITYISICIFSISAFLFQQKYMKSFLWIVLVWPNILWTKTNSSCGPSMVLSLDENQVYSALLTHLLLFLPHWTENYRHFHSNNKSINKIQDALKSIGKRAVFFVRCSNTIQHEFGQENWPKKYFL